MTGQIVLPSANRWAAAAAAQCKGTFPYSARDASILRRGRTGHEKKGRRNVSILSRGGKKGRRDVSSLREGRRRNYERPRFEMADGKRDVTKKG